MIGKAVLVNLKDDDGRPEVFQTLNSYLKAHN